MDLPEIENYQQLLCNDVPMLDVRAPIEFKQGAFPHTINIPLMNDNERTQVGIRYKEAGRTQAIELGSKLVSGDVKQQRVNAWANFVKQHPKGVLYCFRGGLRSKITQQWIYEQTGVIYPRIKGGYKALRRFLFSKLENPFDVMQPVLLSGRTGSGKTLLLQQIQNKIDLEAVYQHRGSAFGAHFNPQPSQIDVENQLAVELLKLEQNGVAKLLIEDESGNIGSRKLPDHFHASMKQAPIIFLETSMDERIDIVFREYVTHALADHQANLGAQDGFNNWVNYLEKALSRIHKRLGGQRFTEADRLLKTAIREHWHFNNPGPLKSWIKTLLEDYYDPMYDYQLAKKKERIVFRGEISDVLGHLHQHHGII